MAQFASDYVVKESSKCKSGSLQLFLCVHREKIMVDCFFVFFLDIHKIFYKLVIKVLFLFTNIYLDKMLRNLQYT